VLQLLDLLPLAKQVRHHFVFDLNYIIHFLFFKLTALTVQYLSNRFIGDYYSGTDMTYPHSFSYMGGSLKTNVDILDTSRPSSDVISIILYYHRIS
jgi:hypothetical protein